MAEQLLQSGTLGESAFIELLMTARGAPLPVVLHASRTADHSRSFRFEGGRLTGFTTTASGEGLGAMLVKRKRLSLEAATEVTRIARSEDVPPDAIIRRLQLLPEPVLLRETSLWATLLLVQSFAWTEGTFRLVQPSGSGDQTLDIDLPAALKSGVFKRIPASIAHDALSSHATAAPALVDDPWTSLAAFGLDVAQGAFAGTLDGSKPLAELLSAEPIPADDLARVVYLLLHTGLVEMRPTTGGNTDIGDLLDDFGLDEKPATESSSASEPTPQKVDFSQIRFGASEGGGRSRTSHTATSLGREELAKTRGRARVQVVTGTASAMPVELEQPKRKESLAEMGSGLFDGIGGGGATPRRAPKPPPKSKGPAIDLPPEGGSFTIEQAEWNRLTTKDKNRIRELVTRLGEMDEQNYFQWLDLPNEAPVISVKKAFFKLAQRFHPDKILDENEVYVRIAEVLFTKISEAYETLGDEEAAQAYIRKAIYGEKDENDLAMEQVQKILGAEADFKKGLRLLNAGKLMSSLNAFESAMKGYPEEGEYSAYYGYVLFRVKQKSDPDEAENGLELIQKGIEQSPAAVAPPHLLGKVYLLKGDGAAAKKAIRESLKKNADNPEALRDYKRADALSKGEDPDARPSDETKKSGLAGLFGRFKKK